MRHHCRLSLLLLVLTACGAQEPPLAQGPTEVASAVVVATAAQAPAVQPVATVEPLPTPAEALIPANSDELPLLRDLLQQQGMGDALMATDGGTTTLIFSEIANSSEAFAPIVNTFSTINLALWELA